MTPWLDDGYSDVEGLHFLRQTLAQRFKRPFGSRVGCLRGHSQTASDRSHVDDASVTPFAHARDYSLNTTESAEEIRLHNRAKHRRRRVFHCPSATNTRIIHENIDAAILREHLVERIADGDVVVDVERGQSDRQLLFGGIL